jgi:microcystin degradation protein MlrC
MHFLLARINHETNTFSPLTTALADFEPLYGDAALADQRHARTALGAFIRAIDALPDASCVLPVSATANPGGTVIAYASDSLCRRVLDAATSDIDAVLLDLHGAMVSATEPDVEGRLLSELRRKLPGVPIAVALDLHGNVTQRMVDNADIIVGFKTYPHVDMAETGEHAARLLLDALAGRTRPLTRWRQLPLLSHTLRSATAEGAMQRAVAAARAAEHEAGVLAVTVMAGFSLADMPDAGVSVVVTTDGDAALAQQVADRIAALIWQEREGFVYRSEPTAQSIARAAALAARPGQGPVLLLDHSDNVMSGGTCDTMDVLQAALQGRLTGIVAGPLCDPQAVSALWDVPLNEEVTVDVGNRIALDALGMHKTPMRCRGRVRTRSDGVFTVIGPIYTGQRLDMGRTVLFDIGDAQLVISEHRTEPYDLGVFRCVGLEPDQASFLLLKSRMYCRPVFGPISRGLVECDADAGGPTSSNYGLFRFSKLRRPVWPLDPDAAFVSG